MFSPQGGSIRGTTIARGSYGLRLLASARLSAQLLASTQETLKRKIRPIKGAEVYMRVFPHTPVCVKGNETRMGKGKGAFKFWAAKVQMGRVVFEIGGGGIREEIAKQALRLAQHRLPVGSEIINLSTPPRLGDVVDASLTHPPASARVPPVMLPHTVLAKPQALHVVKAPHVDLRGVTAGLGAISLDATAGSAAGSI